MFNLIYFIIFLSLILPNNLVSLESNFKKQEFEIKEEWCDKKWHKSLGIINKNWDNLIVEKSKSQDISGDTRSFLITLKLFCPNIPPEKLKQINSAIKNYQTQGFLNETIFWKNEIELVSKFRSPLNEVLEYHKFRDLYYQNTFTIKLQRNSKDSLPFAKFDKKIEDLLEKGKVNSEQRDCPSKLVNGIEALGPPRNQGPIGWCYAYTVADLFTFKAKVKISAIDIANTFNHVNPIMWVDQVFNERDDTELEGGLVRKAFQYAMKNGLCLEENLPSSEINFSGNFPIDNLKRAEKVKAHFDHVRKLLAKPYLGENKDSQETRLKNTISVFEYLCEDEDGDWVTQFPNINLEDKKKLYDFLIHTDKRSFLSVLIDQTCLERFKFKKSETPKLVTKSVAGLKTLLDPRTIIDPKREVKRREILAAIEKEISNDNPVGLGFFSSIFFDKRKPNSGPHSALIVGRETINGSCHYIVRNHWGENSCQSHGYDSQYKCEGGNIWIPEENIFRSLIQIDYMENN